LTYNLGLAEDPFGVFSLVLTPTRELAYQIAEQFRIIGAEINLKVCVVVGGMDMMSQALELAKKAHIVIATPGRLVDHIQSSSNAIFFKRIKFLVLDEADRLGFDLDLNIQMMIIIPELVIINIFLLPPFSFIRMSNSSIHVFLRIILNRGRAVNGRFGKSTF